MKAYLTELVHHSPTPAQARNVAREYLQARILGVLQRAGAMIPLAFHGGTALRMLYATARYSEDLDFALEKDREQYDFAGYLRAIQSEFALENYPIELKVNDKRTVQSAMVRFSGLLYELGLSPLGAQMLAIKIEIDTNPPAGATLATTVVRRHIPMQLQHHDPASLLAGKLHAILQRPFAKGRDLYDLLWYLSDPNWPAPNFVMLNNALQQTHWSGQPLDSENWRAAVRTRLVPIPWDHVIDDVRPFLDPAVDPNILSRENVMRVLG